METREWQITVMKARITRLRNKIRLMPTIDGKLEHIKKFRVAKETLTKLKECL